MTAVTWCYTRFERRSPIDSSPKTVRFGAFEVDLGVGELRKHGLRLRLQEQPFQVLTALLERPGEVVTREELVRRLWPDGTFVDFDRGLNAAVTRLRQALSDSAESPRYVETVARRGYRLIAPVHAEPEVSAPLVIPRKRPVRIWPVVVLGLALLTTVGIWWKLSLKSPAGKQLPDKPLAIIPLTTEPGIAMAPSFSPDGNQVAFQWDQNKREPRIFIRVIGPGEPVRLTTGSAAEFGPAWSPDGRFIAFIRFLNEFRYGVFIVPPLGGAERKLMEFAASPEYAPSYYGRFPGGDLHLIAWTRDASHLIVSMGDRTTLGLLLVSTDSVEKTRLTMPAGNWETSPAVSPDGRLLVLSRHETIDASDLYLLALSKDLRTEGEPRQLTWEARSGRYAESPAWAPDGHEIIYCSNRDGSPRLWRIGLQPGATPRQVPSVGPDSYLPAVSRRGRLVYVRGDRDINIWRQRLSSPAGTLDAPVSLIASTARDTNPQYSPDGKLIAFQSARSGNTEIWLCGSDGGRCRQLTSFNGPLTGTPRWSPDGKQIAFDSAAAGHFNIYVVDADGGAPRRLDDPADAVAPSWSRDGKWIYFTSRRTGRPEIWKLPSSAGAAVQVTRNGGLTAFESPDGESLYYTKASGKSMLWRSRLDGSAETAIADDVVARGFAVTPDQIYYLRQEARGFATLRSLTLATGKNAQIATITKTLHLGLSVSPDRKYALYAQIDHEGSNLVLLEDFH
jgi:Tol biopolymer transport system component/DNA-binding winged helix-turn-helix (wHTH) protein